MYSMMLIIIGMALAIFLTTYFLTVTVKKKSEQEQNKQQRKIATVMKIYFAILFITVVAFIGIIIHKQNIVVKDCCGIELLSTEKILYYDENTDEYFFMESNNWDLNKLFVRDIIPHDVGENIQKCNKNLQEATGKIKDRLE